MPSRHQPRRLSFKRQQVPQKEPLSRADQAKQAQIVNASSGFLRRKLGAGTPNPIQCSSIAIGSATAGNAYSICLRLSRQPVRPSNQTRYPKLHPFILSVPSGDIGANMPQLDKVASVDSHQ